MTEMNPCVTRLRGEHPVRRKYLVGVSGGRDSVALLDCLLQAGFRKLVVCHLNHGLRGRASDTDARFVERLAGRSGLLFVGEKVPVRRLAKAGRLSLETAARQARRSFFARVAGLQRCRRIFLAHHADDQAETVLMNLARGSGIAGLAGMKRQSDQVIDGRRLTFLRPLLDWRRRDIDAWIERRDLKFREDASNADAGIGVRNRVRHELLPAMNECFGRDVTASLLRLADVARENESFVESSCAADLALAERAELPVAELLSLPEAICARMLLIWLRRSGVPDCGLVEVQVVERLLSGPLEKAPARVNLPGGWHARRRSGRIFLQPPVGKQG